MAAAHEKHLEEIAERSKPISKPLEEAKDIRHLPEDQRQILDLKDEIKVLHRKIAELWTENDDLTEIAKLACKQKRYRIPVHTIKGFLDFVDGQEFISATFDQNTNLLEHLYID